VLVPLRGAAAPGFLKVMRDVTGRVLAEERLRASEERFRRALEIETVGVIFFAADGRITEANDAFLAMGGYGRGDLAAGRLRWDALTPPEWMPASGRAIEELRATGRTTPYEKEYHRKDGSRRWGLFAARRLGEDEGVEFVLDVTERRRAEERLRASEERFRQFGDASSDVLWVRDAETLRYEYLSPAFEAVYGEGRERVLGDDDLGRWAALIHPEDREAALRSIARVRGGERATHEFRVVRPTDGQVRWVRDTHFPLLDEAGRVRRIGGAGQDVTGEREAAERQRRLARELDHRVKNVLAVVQAIASQTVRASGSLEGFAEAFEGRLGALARAHGLLTSTGWAGADLRGLAEQTLEPYLDGAAEVAVGGPSLALPPRRAVAVAMVLHELATNAAKHGALSVPGGRVAVGWEVGEGEGGARRVRLAWEEAGGPAVGAAPGRKGFGTALIEQSLRYDLEGTGGLRFEPDGLRCELSFPLG
jgi:PAS domain S-box-containing protein